MADHRRRGNDEQLQTKHDASIARKAYKKAIRCAKGMESYSNVIDPIKEASIPRFDYNELILGNVLGKGGFNTVYELQRIHLIQNDEQTSNGESKSSQAKHKNGRNNLAAQQQVTNRKLLSERVSESGRSSSSDDSYNNYAVKLLSRETMSINYDSDADDDYICGSESLLVETKFLASLDPHPNIVRLYGLSKHGLSGLKTRQEGNYFLILDRLDVILDQRLIEWRREEDEDQQHPTNQNNNNIHYEIRRQERFLSRLRASLQLCLALKHLHSFQICFRDLKPDNIGFDIHGTLKLFDFGIAMELDEEYRNDDGTYDTTGQTGEHQYMAPEVIRHRRYNTTVDVYGFGLLLWQMCSLEEPYKNMSRRTHYKHVVKRQERPKLYKTWPKKLCRIMEQCWLGDPCQRSSSKEIYKLLKSQVRSHQQKLDNLKVKKHESSVEPDHHSVDHDQEVLDDETSHQDSN